MRNPADSGQGGYSRRQVLAGMGGLTFGLLIPASLIGPRAALAQEQGQPQLSVNGWVRIGNDDYITIASPAAEMGQGVMTAVPMIIAEELDADWSRVLIEFSPADAQVFGNPHWGGMLLSVGSKTIEGYWEKVRLQGASVRRVLLQAAAAEWNVPWQELVTEPSIVVHPPSGRRMSYGQIAGVAQPPAEMPHVDPSELKRSSQFRIIGTNQPRVDVPAKVDGSAVFGIDVRLPGMLYATVLRGPAEGSKPEQVDDSAAKKIPGVRQIMALATSVGIIGDRIEAVFAAREALNVQWSKGTTSGYDSERGLDDFRARARNLEDKGLVFKTVGEPAQAFTSAAEVVASEYATDYLYHAQLEPMNVTAQVGPAGDEVDLWVGTQAQSATIGAAASFLKTKPERIRLHQQYLGGGYGRRAAVDHIPDAIALAQAAQAPVKVVWTRQHDLKAAKMRPMTAHYLQAGFDADGNLIGWRHRLVSESVLYYRSPKLLDERDGFDNIVLEGIEPDYEIANQAIGFLLEKRGVGLNSWRGIGAGYNKFAIESFIDELAARRSIDPVEFRRRLMRNNPRALAVIDAVATMSEWGKEREPGRALGFAFGRMVNSWTAGAAEVSVDRSTGVIRAHNFWVAIDAGVAVSPENIVAQTEGNIVFGLSQTLLERVTIADGQVQQSNFFDYPVLRLADVPEIHVRVISTDNPPTGVGEAALPLVACCVGNGVAALTGQRLRHLPFTPDRVKAALATS